MLIAEVSAWKRTARSENRFSRECGFHETVVDSFRRSDNSQEIPLAASVLIITFGVMSRRFADGSGAHTSRRPEKLLH